MSWLLPDYSEDQIRQIAKAFVMDIFKIEKDPVNIIITEHVVLVEFAPSGMDEMIPHEMYELVYATDNDNNITLVNILEPRILIDYVKDNPLPVETN